MRKQKLIERLRNRSMADLPVKICTFNGSKLFDIHGVDVRTNSNGDAEIILIYKKETPGKTGIKIPDSKSLNDRRKDND